jgi:hypothetical protein
MQLTTSQLVSEVQHHRDTHSSLALSYDLIFHCSLRPWWPEWCRSDEETALSQPCVGTSFSILEVWVPSRSISTSRLRRPYCLPCYCQVPERSRCSLTSPRNIDPTDDVLGSVVLLSSAHSGIYHDTAEIHIVYCHYITIQCVSVGCSRETYTPRRPRDGHFLLTTLNHPM